MTEFIYSTGSRWHPERITKWHVEKETEKQFVLREMAGDTITGCQRKVNKSDMHLQYEGHFCITIDEAKTKRKEVIKQIIQFNKKRAEDALKYANELEELLKKCEAQDEK